MGKYLVQGDAGSTEQALQTTESQIFSQYDPT